MFIFMSLLKFLTLMKKVIFRVGLVGILICYCSDLILGQSFDCPSSTPTTCPPVATDCSQAINAAMMIAGETCVCEGATVMVENNTTPLDMSYYVWNWGDHCDTVCTINDLPTHTYTFSDQEVCDLDPTVTFFVLLYAHRPICIPNNHSNGSPVKVRVNPRPSFSADSPVCAGEEVEFTNLTCPKNVTDTTIYQYTWDFGDGTFATGFEPEPHIYDNPGDYQVTLMVENIFCMTDPFYSTMIIKVKEMPEPDYIPRINGIDLQGNIICEGTLLDMLNTSEHSDSYMWSADDNGVGFSIADTSKNPIVSFPGEGD